jgi:hypothetical protein
MAEVSIICTAASHDQSIHDPVPDARYFQPAKPEDQYFRDYPVGGHIPDTPKSTRMTLSGHPALFDAASTA